MNNQVYNEKELNKLFEIEKEWQSEYDEKHAMQDLEDKIYLLENRVKILENALIDLGAILKDNVISNDRLAESGLKRKEITDLVREKAKENNFDVKIVWNYLYKQFGNGWNSAYSDINLYELKHQTKQNSILKALDIKGMLNDFILHTRSIFSNKDGHNWIEDLKKIIKGDNNGHNDRAI